MRKNISEWFAEHKFSIILCSIFLGIGIVLGFGINYKRDFDLAFDDKINPTDVLQTFVGVLLVWFIANILDKEKDTHRNAKNIIQNRVRELHDLIDRFSERKFEENYAYTDATTSLKRIETGIRRIQMLLGAAKINFPDDILKETKDGAADLDDLLTNIPVRDKNDTTEAELEVTDGICRFGRDRLKEINVAFDRIKDALLQLEMNVNGT